MRASRISAAAAGVLFVGLALVAAPQPLDGVAEQPPAQGQQPPTFRTGVKLVRVDVSVTANGDKPVSDLKAEDFEAAEDGVVQKVETAQFVRLFVIFLDDYHIDREPAGTIPLRRKLTVFISRFQPADLVAIVDPITPVSAITFTRSLSDLTDIVRRFDGRHKISVKVKRSGVHVLACLSGAPRAPTSAQRSPASDSGRYVPGARRTGARPLMLSHR